MGVGVVGVVGGWGGGYLWCWVMVCCSSMNMSRMLLVMMVVIFGGMLLLCVMSMFIRLSMSVFIMEFSIYL